MTAPPIVICGSCNGLLDEPPGTSPQKRVPCPACGSTSRTFKVLIEGRATVHGKLRLKARHSTSGKPFVEMIIGNDLYRKMGKWMKLERIIDRAKDLYRKVIIDPETGQVIHKCEEPLSEHRGHGSAKGHLKKKRD